MTAMINAMTSGSLNNAVIGSTLNIIVILVFLCILVIREFLRSIGDVRAEAWIRMLNTAAFPLLVVFITVIALRFSLIFEIHVVPQP